MTLGNSLGDLILIVAAVGGEGSDWIGDLFKQSVSHRGIIDFLVGHCDGDDLAAGGVDTDMQLAPGSSAGRSVLFDQPFAGSSELQASAVHPANGADRFRLSGGAAPSVLARRLKVEWSGTARSSPSSPMTEPISPSVCRSGRPNAVPIVKAVLIAKAE